MSEREIGHNKSGSEFKAPEYKRPIKVIKANKDPEGGIVPRDSLDLKYGDIEEVTEPGDEKKDVFLGHEPNGVESLRLDVRKKEAYKGSTKERKDALEEFNNLFKKE